MPTKLMTKSIYWLTFARIVNGDIELKASHLRELLEKPVPPFSYKPLCQQFNKHLVQNISNPSFIDFFTMGPNKRTLSEGRRQELKSMYLYLVEDRKIQIKEQKPGIHRFFGEKFHVPLVYDAIFRTRTADSAFMKYLFAYSDREYIATNQELDVLLALSTVEIPRQLMEREKESLLHSLFPNHVDQADHEFWAVRFSAFMTATRPTFYTVKPTAVEGIVKRVEEVSRKLDVLLERIEQSNKEIDENLPPQGDGQ